MGACLVCGLDLRDERGERRYCSVACRDRASYARRRSLGLEAGASDGLACVLCRWWRLEPQSDTGGLCEVGRWRVCKPYLPGARPWAPIED